MEFFVSTLLFGISVGGQYALIAIGYTMVYGILRLINFAHGDVFMVAGLLGIYLSSFLSAYLPPAAVIPVSLLLVLALTVALGFCIERAAYKPLRSAPRMSVMISAIGVSYLLQNSATYITGGQPMTSPSIPFLSDTISLAGTSIKWVVILTPFLVAALVCLTTMTRMVEEQRITIGGMKALGYSKGAIAVKYVGYGFLASAAGAALGLAAKTAWSWTTSRLARAWTSTATSIWTSWTAPWPSSRMSAAAGWVRRTSSRSTPLWR